MLTDALALAQRHKANNLPERLTWGPVSLSVTNLDRARSFWTDILGFVPRPTEGAGEAFGTAERTLVVLQGGATAPVAKGCAGMYHVAFGLPSQAEFSRMLARLIWLGTDHAAVDHLMSKAIYLSDPDGHGLEISYETPDRFGRFGSDRGRSVLIDTGGHARSGREPLDLAAELAACDGTDPGASVHRRAVVAHLHLHVPGLAAALTWFERLGFARNLTLPEMGMADMGAGGQYTHRLALNLWAGKNVGPAPASSARILSYTLHTTDTETFEKARSQLVEDPRTGDLTGTDPAGIAVRLRQRCFRAPDLAVA
jgi:catechol 2,3-dioxygenase